MNMTYLQEENDAWFSRADRFDGFDRGDIGNLELRDGPYEPFPELEAAYEAMLHEEVKQ